ncbi:MAG: 2-succinyl-5-enolpyruvyl-6-hydroxy-3-cyclohexene-1-carboxylic-acid synthase [Chlamydiae bacterium]|nr:2-succinyl-5-enolpyruvyl-6-hydroxy-3-cyclohexene-1-carboxylic-acid synthase [Chlamydiota bacterium]
MPAFLDTYASWMIQELVAHGVKYFCLAPGSRSTPLVLAVNEHPLAHTFVHFDERALAFHALGYSKVTREPSVIIVTSGTAVGNLLPAIMEAHASCIPLLILTADRPQELQECGANQATNQEGIFHNFVRWQLTMPHPEKNLPCAYLKTTLAHAVFKTKGPHPGPVHLNCQFREPLFLKPPSYPENYNPQPPYTSVIPTKQHLSEEDCQKIAYTLNKSSDGLILVGYEAFHREPIAHFCEFADKLQWPIFQDILSGLEHHPLSVEAFDFILRFFEETPTPQCIVHFGGGFVSKHLLNFLKKIACPHYLHISPYPTRQDPSHLVSHRIHMQPLNFCEQLTPHLKKKTNKNTLWQEISSSLQEEISSFLDTKKLFTEPHLFHLLSRCNLSHYALFLASSMPIRDASHFLHRKPKHLYGNRGLSGIDGNIATAIGIASALAMPLLAILGDQTFLHDLTSLAQIKTLKHPLKILLFNNGGGAIFTHLPIYEKKEVCDQYFIASHSLQFEAIAKLFSLDYFRYTDLENLEKDLPSLLLSPQHSLIECLTSKEENLTTRETLHNHVMTYAKHILLRA